MAVGEKGKQLAELAPCTFAVCDRRPNRKVIKLSDWLNWKGQLQQVARNRAVL